MKAFGLMFNARRVFLYYMLLIFGLSLMAYGVLLYYGDQRTFEASLTDEEIVIRAKALGMIEVKDNMKEENEDDQN